MYIPMPTVGDGELLQQQVIRPRSRRARAAQLRPMLQREPPATDLVRIAHGVLAFAGTEAEFDRAYPWAHIRGRRASRDTLKHAYEALAFLTDASPDSDLSYWCGIAGIRASCVAHRFRPTLERLLRTYGSLMPVGRG